MLGHGRNKIKASVFILAVVMLLVSSMMPTTNATGSIASDCHVAGDNGGNGSTVSVQCAVTPHPGAVLVVMATGNTGATTPSIGISDSLTDSFSNLAAQTCVGQECRRAVAANLSSSTADTITVTINSAASAYAYAGFQAFVLDYVKTSGAVTSTGSGSGSTLSVGSFTQFSGITIATVIYTAVLTPTAGSGYTLYPSTPDAAASVQFISEYQVGGSGSTTAPMTLSGSSTWVELAVSLSGVTLPITCTVPDGGPSTSSIAVSVPTGDGTTSQTTITCSSGGTTTNVDLAGSTTVTLTVPADGANTRYRFSSGLTTATDTSCSTGTCSAWSVSVYYQTQDGFKYLLASGGNTVSGDIQVRYQQYGATQHITFLPSDANTTVNTVWVDSGTTTNWDFVSQGSSPTGERWANSAGTNETDSFSGGPTTVVATYYDQYYYSVSAKTSTPNDKTLSYTNYATLTLTQFGNPSVTLHVWDNSGNTTFADKGGSVSFNSLTSAQSNTTTRWELASVVTITPVSGAGSISAVFFEQEYTTWNLSLLSGSNNLGSGLQVKIIWRAFNGTLTSTGSSLPTTPSQWVDYGIGVSKLVSVSKASYSGSLIERWITYGANQTADVDAGHHGGQTYSWVYQDELRNNLIFQIQNGGLGYTPVTSFKIEGANATVSASLTSATNVWMSRGFNNATAIIWEANDVVLPVLDKINAQNPGNTYTYQINVWQVSFANAFKDAGGTALYRLPSSITMQFANTTITTASVPSINATNKVWNVLIQNGTSSIQSIIWENSALQPLASYTFDASTNQTPDPKYPVYSLTNSFSGFEGIGETSTSCTVTMLFSNGTTIDYPSGIGNQFNSWNTNVNFAQVQNGSITYHTYWRGQQVNGTSQFDGGAVDGFTTTSGFSVNVQSNSNTVVINYIWFDMANSGIELFESNGNANIQLRIWDSTNEFMYWEFPTQGGYQVIYWGTPGPGREPVNIQVNSFVFSSSTSIFTNDPVNEVMTLQVGGGTLVADFSGNLGTKPTPGYSVQPSPATTISTAPSTYLPYPSIVDVILADFGLFIVDVFNAPYGLGLILPLFLVILTLLVTRKAVGPRPTVAEPATKVIVERRGGPSPLRMVLTTGLSSAIGAGVLVFLLPYLGYVQLTGLSFQDVLLVMFATGSVATVLVWAFVHTSTSVRTEQ